MRPYLNHDDNWDCDGDHCTEAHGEVRVYPLGGGANLILCRDCFAHENAYRRTRASETGQPENWPQVSWDTAKRYKEET
jgi:hypothetical protein